MSSQVPKGPVPIVPFNEAGVPEQLRSYARFLVWRYTPEGKKPPYDFRTGRPCDSNAPAVFATFGDALAGYRAGGYSGLGFALDVVEGFVCIDLDDCRDPQTGAIAPSAQRIIDEFKSYTEVSPSGDGVKIFIRAHAGSGHKKPGAEILTRTTRPSPAAIWKAPRQRSRCARRNWQRSSSGSSASP